MATKKKTEPANKVGRPTDYRPEYCGRLIDHMSKGLSYETFGALIDVSKQTIYDWEARFPEFLDAKKTAFTKCQLFWENIGVEGIWNYPNEKTLNTGNYVFQMKNRFKWTDRVDVTEHKPQTTGLEDVSDDELDAT